MPAPLLLTLGLGVLSASLALLLARLGVPIAADAQAVGSGLLGVAAFVAAAVSTVRSARKLSARHSRR
jgi:hypothetical protein